MHIHWHEGLFLLPHHLQRLQKTIYEGRGEERRLAWSYPYGTVEMQLSTDDLKNRRLRFSRLHVVMPGGTVVDYPKNAALPVIDFKDALAAESTLTISLGIPLWFEARANTMKPGTEQEGAKVLYRVQETEVMDENTGSNPKPMLLRQVNARLLINDEDRNDMEVIPIMRVTRGTGEGLGEPHQDPEFVGPTLILAGSNLLWELVENIISQIQASADELQIQLTRSGFSIESLRGVQFEQMLRLRALNRARGRLTSLVAVSTVTPFAIYLELQDLLNDLATLHPEQDMLEAPAYNHDDPYPVFDELYRRINLFLRGGVKPTFLKVEFVPDEYMLVADLTEDHIKLPEAYYLGIQTTEDPISLARFVENEDQFKLMPASMASRAVRGILLKEERLPPLELPSRSGLYFFRLRNAECREMWQRICEERKAIVRWSGRDEADYQATLYMTLPPKT